MYNLKMAIVKRRNM